LVNNPNSRIRGYQPIPGIPATRPPQYITGVGRRSQVTMVYGIQNNKISTYM
jgi:hypothetical protein